MWVRRPTNGVRVVRSTIRTTNTMFLTPRRDTEVFDEILLIHQYTSIKINHIIYKFTNKEISYKSSLIFHYILNRVRPPANKYTSRPKDVPREGQTFIRLSVLR